MSSWKARRPKSRRLVTSASVPLSIAFVGATVTYITVYAVMMTVGLTEGAFARTFDRLQNFGQQVAVDSGSLIAVAWPVVLSLVAAVFFVSRSSGPQRHSVERRIIAMISILITGVVLSALILSIVGSIGHQATANRLWLLAIATLFLSALTWWLGNDALSTRRRLRASARTDMRSWSRLARRYRPVVGRTVRGAGWWLLLMPLIAVVLTILVVTLTLAMASGANFGQVLSSLDSLTTYGRFAIASAVAVVIASMLISFRSATRSATHQRWLARSAVIALIPSSAVPVLFAVVQSETSLVWAIRGALLLSGWMPLLLLAVPARTRLSTIWCLRCVELKLLASAAHDARRDWLALRKRNDRESRKRQRPMRTTPSQLRALRNRSTTTAQYRELQGFGMVPASRSSAR